MNEKNVMSLAEAREKQLTMVVANARDPLRAGYGVMEAANSLNEANCDVILAMERHYGSVYIGSFNHGSFIGAGGLRKYNGEKIYNFSCDFCVPRYSHLLDNAIKKWNNNDQDMSLERIYQKIRELDGMLLIWS